MTDICTTMNGDNFPQLKSLACVGGMLKLEGEFKARPSITLTGTIFVLGGKSAFSRLHSLCIDREEGMSEAEPEESKDEAELEEI